MKLEVKRGCLMKLREAVFGKEQLYPYKEGEEVIISVSGENLAGKVVNVSPRTEDLILRTWESLLGLTPMIVRVNEEEEMLVGAEIRAYLNGSGVRPKSLLSGEDAKYPPACLPVCLSADRQDRQARPTGKTVEQEFR